MKKILIAALAVLLVAINAANAFYIIKDSSQVTVVEAVEQSEPMIHDRFVKEVFVPQEISGENIALGAEVSTSAFEGVFNGPKAIDGSREGGSYWEGAKDTYPNEINLNFAKSNIHAIRLGLNPDAIWGQRVQTFSVNYIDEAGESKTLFEESEYVFDPKTGNEVVLEFESVEATGITVVFTGNTGASGGQIAELEVYTESK